MPPTDPLIYRFYELVMVNGPAWKALIEEEFGDGIMSAIDFDMTMERLPDPKGDRVKITMSGKFLPYKYYGATGNEQAYGFKEGLDCLCFLEKARSIPSWVRELEYGGFALCSTLR
jgi:cyanate lyase